MTLPSPEAAVTAAGWLYALLQYAMGKRKTAKVADAVRLGKEAAGWAHELGIRLHIDTRALLAKMRDYVERVGRVVGLTKVQLATALDTAEAELGRLVLLAALDDFEAEMDKHGPAILATVAKAEKRP